MTQFDSFVYLLTNVQSHFEELRTSPAHLIVVESGNTSHDNNIQLTPEQIARLESDGAEERDVLAYVNVAVTVANRSYWNPDWTINPDTGEAYTAENVDREDADRHITSDAAEDWLLDANGHGFATGPAKETDDGEIPVYGRIVDFSHGAIALPTDGTSLLDHVERDSWWHIVLTQVQDQLDAGYTGIFLDDVSRYAAAADQRQAAEDMMNLVRAVQYQIDLHDSEVTLAINGGGFLAGDSDVNFNISAEDIAFFEGVDYIVMENQMNTAPDNLWQVGQFLSDIGVETTLLSIEWQNGLIDDAAYAAFLSLLDVTGIAIEGYLPETAAYDDLFAVPQITPTPGVAIFATSFGISDLHMGTDAPELFLGLSGADTVQAGAGNDSLFGGELGETLDGGDGDDLIFARDGADSVQGGEGSDTIYGGEGNDTIYGGPGDDLIFAGGGDDVIFGGGGNDTIIGGAGSDTIYGEAGDDLISGGTSGDLLSGGEGNDFIYGGDLPDTFVFDL